jgi:hypothetical protein
LLTVAPHHYVAIFINFFGKLTMKNLQHKQQYSILRLVKSFSSSLLMASMVALTAIMGLSPYSATAAPILTASTWSTPVVLAPTGGGAPIVRHDALGNAITIWVGTSSSMVKPAEGAWGAIIPLPAAGFLASDVAFQPNGTAMAIGVGGSAGAYAIQVTTLASGAAAWSTPATVYTSSSATATIASPQLRFDGQGNAVAVWQTVEPNVSNVVQSTYYKAATGWSAAVNLSPTTGFNSAPDFAVNALGDAVVVWSKLADASGTCPCTVNSVRKRAGGAWSVARVLTTNGSEAKVALDGAGRATAIWSSVTAGKPEIFTAQQAAATGAWNFPMQLSDSTLGVYGNANPAVAADKAGNVTAAWNWIVPDYNAMDAGVIVMSRMKLARSTSWSARHRHSPELNYGLISVTASADGSLVTILMSGRNTTVSTYVPSVGWKVPVEFPASLIFGNASISLAPGGKADIVWSNYFRYRYYSNVTITAATLLAP